MERAIIGSLAIALSVAMAAGQPIRPPSERAGSTQSVESKQPDRRYVSPGDRHKVMLFKRGDYLAQLRLLPVAHSIDYGSFLLIDLDRPDQQTLLRAMRPDGLVLRDEYNTIQLRIQRIDTTQPAAEMPEALRLTPEDAKQLQMVRFVGPPKEEWLERLASIGGLLKHYYREAA